MEPADAPRPPQPRVRPAAGATGAAESIRGGYVACGDAETFYRAHGDAYRNPHEPAIAELIGRVVREWPLDLSGVLDLAAGSGEITLALRAAAGDAVPITAIDPFTHAAYAQRIGRACEMLSFEAIADGALRGRTWSLIACSFAMHLVAPSRLPGLGWELAQVGGQLLILTPHKRPEIRPAWGWTLTHEMLHERVRARLYARS